MNILNWYIIVIIIVVALALVIFTIKKNNKDEKDFTEHLNNDYNKMDDEDSESNDM